MILLQESGFKSITGLIENIGSLFDNLDLFLTTTAIAVGLLPFVFLVSLAFNYTTSFIESTSEKPKFYDAKDLKRGVILMVLIPIIPGIFALINTIGDICTGFTDIPIEEEISNMKLMFEMATTLGGLSFFNFNFVSLAVLFCYLFIWIFAIIKFAIILLTGALQVFIIAVSPLATVFSILPFLKGQLMRTVKIALNISLVGTTLNILDRMLYSVILEKVLLLTSAHASDNFTVAFLLTLICFCMLVLYCLTIWLTGLYVGDSSGSAMMNMAVTLAATSAIASMNMAKILANLGSGKGANLLSQSMGQDIAGDIAKGITSKKD